MALTVLTDSTTAINTRTLTATISYSAGDVIVASAMSWDTGYPLGTTPSATGLTFTAQNAHTSPASSVWGMQWTAVASGSGSGVTLTVAGSASASVHNMVVWVCPAADGYSLAATPNVVNTSGLSSGAGVPSGTLTGTSGSLACVHAGDWNGIATAPTYIGTVTQDARAAASGDSTQTFWHQTLTGSSNSIGMTAPTGQTWILQAVEVLATGGGGGGGSARLFRPAPISRAPIIRASSF